MELTIKERLQLVGLLPATGNLATLRTVQELRLALLPGDEEAAALNLHQEGEQLFWNAEADHAKDIPMGTTALSLLVQTLTELNTQERLTLELLPLYDKIVT